MGKIGRIGFLRACAVAVVAVMVAATPAVATPKVGKYGRAIDPIPGYDGASKCDPDPEPGVVAFQQMVLRAYPGTGAGSISRPCSGSATSEHHEGRAWDWGVNAGIRSQKRKADELIAWLIKRDQWGNARAMARRTGVMYLIWNRRIWFPWSGWEVYCEQKKRGCVDPDDGSLRSPHTDHVHFSFTWKGALKKTTFWKRSRSYIAAIEPERTSTGYWLLGRNGSVFAEDAGYYGSTEHRFSKSPYIALASLPGSNGYWMLTANGRVTAMGGARRHGGITDKKRRAVDIEATPTGSGYWIVTRNGRVYPFGSADQFGDARKRDTEIIGMTVTSSGRGYWLLTAEGNVLAYGDARDHGQLEGDAVPVDIAATPSGRGYWVVTDTGRVRAFGDARRFGDLSDKTLRTPISGIAPTPSGRGYRLVTKLGRVFNFGDAT
ncbi:MAG: hypothetical protein KY391_05870 [Actinobacteria bacterium]|nr:hypothetical protein [Actinomycetota bacterium]